MIQDISPWHYDRLRAIGSPAIAAGRVRLFDLAAPPRLRVSASSPSDSDWYMPQPEKARRVAANNRSLRPRRIEAISISVDYGDYLRRTLPVKVKQFDRYVVVTASHDRLSQQVAKECGADLVVSDICYEDGDAFNKGRLLNEGLKHLDLSDWICFTDPDIFFPPWWREKINDLVLNPGCLYYSQRRQLLPAGPEQPNWHRLHEDYQANNPADDHSSWGYFQLLNVRARALGGKLEYPTIFCSAGSVDYWLQAQWQEGKKISLAKFDPSLAVVHIFHGPIAGKWNGTRGAKGGWEYAGQSNLASEQDAARRWPVPCMARRINMATAEIQDQIYWAGTHDDQAPVWPTRAKPAAVYEYSIKRLGART
jgi:hypothetical protein